MQNPVIKFTVSLPEDLHNLPINCHNKRENGPGAHTKTDSTDSRRHVAARVQQQVSGRPRPSLVAAASGVRYRRV
jgi:hypothetical protein